MAQAAAGRGLGNAVAYGVLGLLAVTNDNVSLYVKEIARTTVHFISRPGLNGAPGAFPGAAGGTLLEDKIDRLAASLATSSRASGLLSAVRAPVAAIALVSMLTALVVRALGYSLSDVWWVTRAQFRATTDALREGVSGVASALTKVRLELLEKIGLLDANVDRTREELKTDISGVSDQVHDVRKTLAGLELKINGIEGGMKTANHGIYLLCHVVSDQVNNGGARSLGAGATDMSRPLFKELSNYTREFSLGGVSLGSAASGLGLGLGMGLGDGQGVRRLEAHASSSSASSAVGSAAGLGGAVGSLFSATAKKAYDPTEEMRNELRLKGIVPNAD